MRFSKTFITFLIYLFIILFLGYQFYLYKRSYRYNSTSEHSTTAFNLPIYSPWKLVPIKDVFDQSTDKSQLIYEFELHSPHSELESEDSFLSKGCLHFCHGCTLSIPKSFEALSYSYLEAILSIDANSNSYTFRLADFSSIKGDDNNYFQVCSDSTESLLPFINLLKFSHELKCKLVVVYPGSFFESPSSDKYFFTIDCEDFYNGFLLMLKHNHWEYDYALEAPDIHSIQNKYSDKSTSDLDLFDMLLYSFLFE